MLWVLSRIIQTKTHNTWSGRELVNAISPSLCRVLSSVYFNPFPNKLLFLRTYTTRLLKTLWEKEKLLERAISPCFTVFSTRLKNFLPFLSNFKKSSANYFSSEESKMCCLGKSSTYLQRDENIECD